MSVYVCSHCTLHFVRVHSLPMHLKCTMNIWYHYKAPRACQVLPIPHTGLGRIVWAVSRMGGAADVRTWLETWQPRRRWGVWPVMRGSASLIIPPTTPHWVGGMQTHVALLAIMIMMWGIKITMLKHSGASRIELYRLHMIIQSFRGISYLTLHSPSLSRCLRGHKIYRCMCVFT